MRAEYESREVRIRQVEEAKLYLTENAFRASCTLLK